MKRERRTRSLYKNTRQTLFAAMSLRFAAAHTENGGKAGLYMSITFSAYAVTQPFFSFPACLVIY